MRYNVREQQGLLSGHFPISLPHSGFIASPETTAPPIRAAANKDSRNLTMAAIVFKLLHRSADATGGNVKSLLVLLQLFYKKEFRGVKCFRPEYYCAKSQGEIK